MQLSHHAAAGYVLLSYFLKDSNHPAAITARDHHERCDGSGYPRGIALRDRVVEIVAVSDVFDALISPRPYRPIAYDLRTALEEVTVLAQKGTISADVVRALISFNRKDQPPYADCVLPQELRGTPPPGNLYRGVIHCKYEPDCVPEKAAEPDRARHHPALSAPAAALPQRRLRARSVVNTFSRRSAVINVMFTLSE